MSLRERRPSVEVSTCPICGDVLPFGQTCPRCTTAVADPTEGYQPQAGVERRLSVEALLVEANRRLAALADVIRSSFAGRPQAESELVPLPAEQPLAALSMHRRTRAGGAAVDVLPGAEWRPYQVRTTGGSADPRVVEVVSKDPSRRSVTISNLGTDAVAAANVWVGSSREIAARGTNTHWIPADGSLTLDTSDAVYAIDDGTTPTTLHVAAIYTR